MLHKNRINKLIFFCARNYAVQTLLNYLDGLEEYEKLAMVLGLKVDFDARRVYEWDKLDENLDSFSKKTSELYEKRLFLDLMTQAKRQNIS